MRIILIIAALLFLQAAQAEQSLKAIVKVNSIRGERLVSVSISTQDLEKILEEELLVRGIERVYSQTEYSENLIIVEAFVYQFAADFPSVTLLVRSKNGFHHYDTEFIQIFADRRSATAKITKKVAKRMPNTFDLNKFYEVYIGNLFTQKRVSISSSISNSIVANYSAKYNNSLDWGDYKPIPFLFPDNFSEYLDFCVDYEGFRKKLQGQQVVVNLKITPEGRTEIVDMEAPFKLKEKQTLKIKRVVAALPIWLTNEEITDLTLNLGVN
ncbi:MAG: hypothetical protein AAGG68_08820 [Bacteroidota bacterium]